MSFTRLCRSASVLAARSAMVRKGMTVSTVSRTFSTGSSIFNPTETHGAIRDMVRTFAENEVEPQALEYNRDEKLNLDLLRKCGDLGLLGLTVDEEYGGSGLDAVAACIVHEELSSADPAFCLAYLAHSLLFVNNLMQNGNEAQKQKYLPDVCSGEKIGGMCMSEPNFGTDVLGMKTTAVKDGNDWVLNGQKMWITNGALDDETLGDVFLVYAQTGESLSLFLVEKDFEGFTLGQRIKDKLGMRASTTAELVFEDVRIPGENLIGEEGGAVVCMMRNLEIERLGLAAMSCGIAKRSFEVMNKYANERQAFGKPIITYGQIQKHVTESYANYMACRTYMYSIANNLDLSKAGNRLETDAIKLVATTMGKQVSDSAIQVLGGNGYIGEYVVERLWRDSKLLEIGGGTLESHHKNMARDLARIEKIE